MALVTFSAIVEFALKGEESGIGFFSSSLQAAPETGKDVLARSRTEAEKNLKMFRTILRENVTEIVMEPCEALDEAAYLCDFSGGDALKKSLELLEKQRDFLRRAAGAVNLAEVKRAFQKIADRKGRLISEISRLAG